MRRLNIIFLLICTKIFSQSLTDNLLLHYTFEGDTNDSSVNGNHAINFGATFVDDRFGNPNSAIYFDGIDDYINFPNISELKPNLPVSFSFWINYDSTDLDDREVFNTSFEDDRNTGVFFNSQASTGNYAINYGDGSYSYVSSTRRSYVSNSSIQVNSWHQIIIIVNSANDMKIYFDCSESGGVYSGSGGALQYSDSPGCIGRHDRNLGVPANYFKGAIDDFRYWDRALTDENVAELLSSTFTSSVSFTNMTGCDSDDGAITIADLEPNVNYTITYNYLGSLVILNIESDGTGETTILGLPEGVYEEILITNDATGCSSDLGQITIEAPNIEAQISSTDPTSCNSFDGIISISDLLASESYTVSYTLDNVSESVTTTSSASGIIEITGLGAGTYESITIVEVSSGCSGNLVGQVLVSPSFTASISSTNPTSCNSSDGIISISGLLASEDYTVSYTLNNVQETVSTTSNTSGAIEINGLDSGNYESISIEEASSGCSGNLANQVLNSPNFSASISSTNPSSCGVSDGVITISGLLVNSNYEVSFLKDSVLESRTLTSNPDGELQLNNLDSGVFEDIFIEEQATTCSINLGQIFLDAPDFNVSIISITASRCVDADPRVVISVPSMNSAYSVSYTKDAGSVKTTGYFSGVNRELILDGLGAGVYENVVVAEDATGCSVNLGQITLETLSFQAEIRRSESTDCDFQKGGFVISGLAVNSNYTVSFSKDSVMESSALSSNGSGELHLTDLAFGEYDDILVTDNHTGCSDDLGDMSLSCERQVPECFEVKPFFTPNDDGYNDTWSLEMKSASCLYELHIYDRYGKLLKTLSPENKEWDGTYRGANMPSTDYWFVVTYNEDGTRLKFQSHFTLVR